MTRRGLRLLLACALPAALLGCGDEYPDTISRERFVAANVALRRAGDTVATAADSARARAATLKRLGVTNRELQGYVDARRNDTEDLAATWREIADRLARQDSVARADSVRRDSLARRDSVRTDSLARRDTAARRDSLPVRGAPRADPARRRPRPPAPVPPVRDARPLPAPRP